MIFAPCFEGCTTLLFATGFPGSLTFGITDFNNLLRDFPFFDTKGIEYRVNISSKASSSLRNEHWSLNFFGKLQDFVLTPNKSWNFIGILYPLEQEDGSKDVESSGIFFSASNQLLKHLLEALCDPPNAQNALLFFQ